MALITNHIIANNSGSEHVTVNSKSRAAIFLTGALGIGLKSNPWDVDATITWPGTDTGFFVNGSSSEKAVIGGDLVVSGSTTFGEMSVDRDMYIGDDLLLTSDSSKIRMGQNDDAVIAHNGSTGLNIDVSGSLSMDAAAASNLTTSSGALTLTSAAAATWSTAAGALTIDAAAAGLVLDGHTGVDIDASNSGKVSIDGAGGIDIGVAADVAIDVDASTFDLDASGALTMTATTMAFDPSSSFDLDAAGAITIDGASITLGGDSDTAFDIDTSTLDIDSSGAITIDGTSTISIDGADNMNFSIATGGSDAKDLTIASTGGGDSSVLLSSAGTGADAMSLDVSAGSMVVAPSLIDGKTLTLGNTSSTAMTFTPHGTAGSEKILVKNTAGTADDALKLWSAAGGITLLAANDSLHIDADGTDADALNIDSAGGIDIDAAGAIDILGASTLSIDAVDDSNLTVTASGKDLDIAVAGGSTQELRLASAGTGASALHLNASAGGINVDSADMIDIDAADEITIDTTSADGHIAITSAHTAGDSIVISANADAGAILNVDAGIMDVDVQGAYTLDASGVSIDSDAASNLTTSSGALTLTSAAAATWSTAAGALTIDAAAAGLVLDGHTGVDIDASNSGKVSIDGAGGIDIGVAADVAIDIDSAALDIDASGAITIDGTSTFSVDAGGALNIDTSSGALSVGTANSGIAVSIGHTVSETTVNDNLTVTGDLTVNGATVTMDVSNLNVEDPFISLGIGVGSANSNSGIIFVSGSSTGATRPDVAFARVANDVWGLGSIVSNSGSITSATGMTHDVSLRAAKFEVEGSANYIELDTDLKIVSAADVVITGDLVPSADDTYDLGTTTAAWQDLHLEGDISMTDAGTVSTTAGALTLTSAAAATWSTSAGALVIDGAGGLTLDSDGTDAVNLGTEAAAKTITIGNAASTKVDINALALDFDSAAATDILAATTLSAKGATGASFGDDTGTWEFDGSGAVSETGMTSLSATPSGAVTLTAGAASTWSTSAGALTLTSAAAATWSTSAGALVIDGAGGLTLDSDGTDAVNLGTEAAAKTITIGNAASTKVDVNALAIELDAAASVVVDAVTTMDLDSAGVMSLNSSAAAINIGNDDVDAAINIGTQGERTVSISTGAFASTVAIGNATGASAVTITSGTGDIALDSADDITVDAGGVLELNSDAGAISIGSDDNDYAINIGTQGERTVSISTGAFASTVNIGNATGATAMTLKAGSGHITLDSAADIVLDADGADVIFKDGGTESARLTMDGTTSFELAAQGDIILDPAGNNVLPGSDSADSLGRGAGGSTTIADDFASYVVSNGTDYSSSTTVVSFTSLSSEIQNATSGDTITLNDGSNTFTATLAGAPSATLTKASGFGSYLAGTALSSGTSSVAQSGAGWPIAVMQAVSGDAITIGSWTATVASAPASTSGTLGVSSASGSQSEINGGITTTIIGDGVSVSSASGTLDVSAMNGGCTVSVTRSVSVMAWANIYVDNVDLDGQGRIDLDDDQDTSIRASSDDVIDFELGGTDRFQMTTSAILPKADNSYDLGSSSYRFRNIYTGDLNLRNDRGDWTLIEEDDFISFRNNKTGNRFRMIMEDITGTGNYGPGNDGEM